MTMTHTILVDGIYRAIPSEDVAGFVARPDGFAAWVIDGASTLSNEAFTTYATVTDCGWFARQVSRFFETELAARPFSPVVLSGEIAALRHRYDADGGDAAPEWAHPVAAAMIVEVTCHTGTARIRQHRYADCFAVFGEGEVAADVAETQVSPGHFDPWKPCSGFDGARLEALRARRCQQQRNEESDALTLNPLSAFNVHTSEQTITRPFHALLGSDGLARLWEGYALFSRAAALERVRDHGAAHLFECLRRYEAEAAAGPKNEKRRDDASAVHVVVS